MRFRSWWSAVCVLFACNATPPPEQAAPDPQRGGFFDADTAPRANRVAFVRDAAPSGLAITAESRARGATTRAGVAALAHLAHHADRWGLSTGALSTVVVSAVIENGATIVARLGQRIDGVEVARTRLAVVMNRDLSLVAFSGSLHPAAIAAKRAPIAALSASDALARVFDDLKQPRPPLTPLTEHAGYQRFDGAGLEGPARAKRVFYPVGDQLVLAWETEVAARDDAKKIVGTRHVFAGDDGRVLHRSSLTADAAFSYRVWAEPNGELRPLDGPQAEYTPHPAGAPNGFDPAFIAPSLVTIDGFNHNPQGTFDPWLPAGATTTNGNNVSAYLDIDGNDGFTGGDLIPTTTAAGVFDRTYNTGQQPDANQNQRMAAGTHLFFVINWLHDYFYDSGFTEAAGNAQASNLGRGGAEADVLLAEGQDSSGTDNANMFTPADGTSPRMQMFLWDAPAAGPRRDGTIDTMIIAHEWGHYIHHRLVDCGAASCRSMSEGWGDFMALFTALRATDNLAGTWAVGSYAMRTFTANAAYFGIRRYPYSTDFTKSPLTFKYMTSGVAMPSGPAFTDVGFLQGSDNWEPHNGGEIWTAMLWEGLIDIVKQSQGAAPRYSFDEARRRYANYVVAGMAAAPVETSILDQRDAILAAALAADAQDFVVIARAFARRGFGARAVGPTEVDSFDGSGIVENFDVVGSLAVDAKLEEAASCDNDGVLDLGERGLIKITVQNIGAEMLAGTTLHVASTNPGIDFPDGPDLDVGPIPAGEKRDLELKVQLIDAVVRASELGLTVTANDASAAVTSVAHQVNGHAQSDVQPATSPNETFEDDPFVWSANADGFERTRDETNHATIKVRVAIDGDHTLTTPALAVTAGSRLSISFKHRYKFTDSFFDGGVIEVSTDNGATFTDVTDHGAAVAYTGMINQFENVLGGRLGYVGTSLDFPAYTTETFTVGPDVSGQVLIRFRAGGSFANGSSWEIDDVMFSGITNTPFPSAQPETEECVIKDPPPPDSGGCCGTSRDPRGALALGGVVLVLIGRRRRRG